MAKGRKRGGSIEEGVFNREHLNTALNKRNNLHAALSAIEQAHESGHRICKNVLAWLETQLQNARAKRLYETLMEAIAEVEATAT